MEDHLNIGEFRVTLFPDETATFLISTETSPDPDGVSARIRRQSYEEKLAARSPELPPRLVLAADQFVVRRPEPDGTSIIAGYHWLRDWGRDTLISLPGLC